MEQQTLPHQKPRWCDLSDTAGSSDDAPRPLPETGSSPPRRSQRGARRNNRPGRPNRSSWTHSFETLNMRQEDLRAQLWRREEACDAQHAEAERLRECCAMQLEDASSKIFRDDPSDSCLEAHDLRHQLQELRALHNKRVQDYEGRLHRLERKCRELSADNQQLRDDAEEQNKRHAQAKELNFRLGREIQQARQERTSATGEAAALREEMQRMSDNCVSVHEELQVARREAAEEAKREAQKHMRIFKQESARHAEEVAQLVEAEVQARRQVRRWQERAKVLAMRAQGAVDTTEEFHLEVKELRAKERRTTKERNQLVGQLSFFGWQRRVRGEPPGEVKETRARVQRLAKQNKKLVEQRSFLEWKLGVVMKSLALKQAPADEADCRFSSPEPVVFGSEADDPLDFLSTTADESTPSASKFSVADETHSPFSQEALSPC